MNSPDPFRRSDCSSVGRQVIPREAINSDLDLQRVAPVKSDKFAASWPRIGHRTSWIG